MVRQERAILTAQLIIRLGVKILMKYSKRKRPRKKAKRNKIAGVTQWQSASLPSLMLRVRPPSPAFLTIPNKDV